MHPRLSEWTIHSLKVSFISTQFILKRIQLSNDIESTDRVLFSVHSPLVSGFIRNISPSLRYEWTLSVLLTHFFSFTHCSDVIGPLEHEQPLWIACMKTLVECTMLCDMVRHMNGKTFFVLSSGRVMDGWFIRIERWNQLSCRQIIVNNENHLIQRRCLPLQTNPTNLNRYL